MIAHYDSVIFALLMVALHFALEPARWLVYAGALQAHQAYRRLLGVFSFSALCTYLLPPKLGLPLRVYLLNTQCGIAVAPAAAVLALDGLLCYACWGIGALAGLWFLTGPGPVQFAGSAMVAPAVVLVVVVPFTLLGLQLQRRSRQESGKSTERRTPSWRALLDSVRGLRSRAVAGAAALTVAGIAGHVLRHWALTDVVGAALPVMVIGAIAAISLFSGLVSQMPMGLGGYDIVLIALLQQAGVPLGAAVSVALLNRACNLVVALALGSWGGIDLGLRPFRQRRELAESLKDFRGGGRAPSDAL